MNTIQCHGSETKMKQLVHCMYDMGEFIGTNDIRHTFYKLRTHQTRWNKVTLGVKNAHHCHIRNVRTLMKC